MRSTLVARVRFSVLQSSLLHIYCCTVSICTVNERKRIAVVHNRACVCSNKLHWTLVLFFLLSPPFPLRKHNAFDFWLYFSHCCAAHPHGCVALISRWHSYSPAPTESLGFFSQLYLKERRKERKRRKKSRIVHTCHSFFLSLQLCGPASRNPKGIGARGNLGPQWEMGQDVPTHLAVVPLKIEDWIESRSSFFPSWPLQHVLLSTVLPQLGYGTPFVHASLLSFFLLVPQACCISFHAYDAQLRRCRTRRHIKERQRKERFNKVLKYKKTLF